MKDKLEALSSLFAPWNTSHAPGVAVGVRQDGEILLRRGYGLASVEAGTALTPNSRLRIGSTTKHFTALIALLLAEDGLLDLDAPVRESIAELQGPGGDPSVRQLLQHRGGSRCYLDLGFIAHGMAVPPRGRILEMQRRQQGRNFAVGEAMIYNNGGYQMAALACERVAGQPLGTLMEQRLFRPLGMSDTALVRSDYEIHPGIATLHVQTAEGGWRRGLFPCEELGGDGAIVSTVDDMLVWMQHLRERDRFGSPAVWRQLLEQPPFANGEPGGPYALGLIRGHYRDAPVVHHAGGVIGGSSQMLTFPAHGLDVVVIANHMGGIDCSALAERVADVALEGRLGPPAPSVKAADHPGLAGCWWSADTRMVYELREDGEDLKAAICASAALKLAPLANGRALLSPASIGDAELDLAGAARSGVMKIRFGGQAASYTRLAPTDAAAGAALQGRYHSDDADCTLRIALEGEGEAAELVAHFSGPFGMSACPLKLMSDGAASVAIAARHVSLLPFAVALSFISTGGPVRELVVNTPRTRHLVFKPA